MKSFIICIGIMTAPVAVLGSDAEIEALKRELNELRQRTEELQRKLSLIEQNSSPGVTNTSPAPALESRSTSDGAATVTAPDSKVADIPPAPTRSWSPSDPIQIGSAANYVNISLVGLGAVGGSTAEDVEELQLGGHDPSQRGFTLQNAELTLEGMVDPYLRGQASVVMFLSPEGETEVELEEAFLETLSLPANLQLRAGHFLTEFGRHNPTHPHTWNFVDSPLVNARFFGGDGLRNPGARLSWLAPTPFYSELFLAVQNSHGETAHSFRNDREGDPIFGRPGDADRLHSFGDLLFTPRYAVSFDLTDTQTLLAGASAAFGPNATGGSADTQIYGADLFWKWTPANQMAGFPFVSWQTEAMVRRFEAGDYEGDPILGEAPLPGETLTDYGFYSQLSYGFRKGWVAGFRGDYVAPYDDSEYLAILGPDLERASRWRLSPNLTWYPSEFSKIRLQYNYDHRNLVGDDHSVWLQFEFLLGSHAAHQF